MERLAAPIEYDSVDFDIFHNSNEKNAERT